MSGAEIVAVTAWEALDSRGTPTVGCEVRLAGGGHGQVIVPSGASTGGHEAHELRDGDPDRYDGRGVRRAVRNVRGGLSDAALGRDAGDQEGLDEALCAADGTPGLERLGANAVLAVSLATCLAAADGARTPLYRHLAGDRPAELPLPMVNVVSGGAHAADAIDLQDVLVVPVGADTLARAIEWARRVRERTADVAEERGMPVALVADEGGLGLALGSNADAFELVVEGIERAGLQTGTDVAVAVDVAANRLRERDGYRLAVEGRSVTAEEWADELAGWCDRYPIVSIEDPFAEDDWAPCAALTARIGDRVQVLGDDLFATDQARLERGIESGAANAVLLKPNQAGTLSRTAATWRRAVAAGYRTVLSARSGDSEDSWLADLAVAWSTGQIKVGSTTRSERTAKWNRLLQIEAELGTAARLAHPFAR